MGSLFKSTSTTGNVGMALSILDKTKNGYAPNEKNWKRLKETLQSPEYQGLDVSVVSMAGPKRIGKSTVLNFMKRALAYWEQIGRLDDRGWIDSEKELSGFATGSDDDIVTTGILIWSRPFVLTDKGGKKYAVILMDTQGSFDSISTTTDNAAVYAFSTLLASVQIYNVHHTMDDNCLSYLNTFTAFGQHTFSADVKPYQHLTVLVRNWTLKPGKPTGFQGGTDHLEKELQVTSTMDADSKAKRTNLRNAFQSISCFLMRGPGDVALAENDMSKISDTFKNDLHELISGSISHIKTVNETELKCGDLVDYMNHLLVVFDNSAMPAIKDVFAAMKQSVNEMALKCAVENYRSKILEEARTAGFDAAHKKLADLARQAMTEKLMDAKNEGERFEKKLVGALDGVLKVVKLEVEARNGDVVKERTQQFSDVIQEAAKTEHVDKAFDRCKAEPLHGLGDLIQGGPELVEKAEQEIKAKMEEERQKIQAKQSHESEQKLQEVAANYEQKLESTTIKDSIADVDQTLRLDALKELRTSPGTDQSLESRLTASLNGIKEKIELKIHSQNQTVIDNCYAKFKRDFQSAMDSDSDSYIDKKFEECKQHVFVDLEKNIKGGEVNEAKQALTDRISDLKQDAKRNAKATRNRKKLEEEMADMRRREREREEEEARQRNAPLTTIGRFPNSNSLDTALNIRVTNHTTTTMYLDRFHGDTDVSPQTIPGRHIMRYGGASLSGDCDIGAWFDWKSLKLYFWFEATGGLIGWAGNKSTCRICGEIENEAKGGQSMWIKAKGLKISWNCGKGKRATMDVDVEEVT